MSSLADLRKMADLLVRHGGNEDGQRLGRFIENVFAGLDAERERAEKAERERDEALAALVALREAAGGLAGSIRLVRDAAYHDRDDHRYAEFYAKQEASLARVNAALAATPATLAGLGYACRCGASADRAALDRALAGLDTAAREHDERVRAEGRAEQAGCEAGDKLSRDVDAEVAAADRAGWDAAIEAAARHAERMAREAAFSRAIGSFVAGDGALQGAASAIRALPYQPPGDGRLAEKEKP